jgi:hypothetical protein
VNVQAVVEGPIDESVVSLLVRSAGATLGEVYGNRGKPAIAQRIAGYNQAAAVTGIPWVVLVDLDRDAPCAVPLRTTWLPTPAPTLCLRIAARAVEAWLLADPDRTSVYFGIRRGSIPEDPEALPDPKRTLVDLCQSSRRATIRSAVVPRPGSGRAVGAGYTSTVREFVLDAQRGWRPEVAAARADSLDRAMRCIRRIAGAAG